MFSVRDTGIDYEKIRTDGLIGFYSALRSTLYDASYTILNTHAKLFHIPNLP